MNQYSAKTVKAVFFMSGFAALIYQIAWQRMLFTAFGVDLLPLLSPFLWQVLVSALTLVDV